MALILVFIMASVFVFLFYLVNFMFAVSLRNKRKVRPYECGFGISHYVQNSFSIHFFIIMLMFILFDLEVVMLLGVLISDLSSFFVFLFIIFFIMVGLYIE